MMAGDRAFEDKRRLPPCRAACPADVNVQGYIALLQQGRFKESVQLVRKSIPFPAICGRVCRSPCEDACARKNVDEPVSIRALKWLIADIEREQGQVEAEPIPKMHTEKVAIIGAGPAGLSAAYELAKLGYPVTVFEAMPEPGGMMRYFIPDSLLRKDVVANEIAYIQDLGVEIKTGVTLGRDVSIDSLRTSGPYEAIFVAIGIQRVWGRKLKTQLTSPLASLLPNTEEDEVHTKSPTISVDPLTLETRIPGVFAGGDMVAGKATSIVNSIAVGKRAAVSIDRRLNGQDLRTGREEAIEETTWVKDWMAIAKKPKRYAGPSEDHGKRRVSFEEAEGILAKTKEAAMLEARRCLECGPCSECLGSEGLCEANEAIVHETLCTGCNICVAVCLFGAIKKDERGVARVDNDSCKGCGACSVSCPEGAIIMRRFTDAEIAADITAALRR